MKSITGTLARQAQFDTTDYASAKERACAGFKLTMVRSDLPKEDNPSAMIFWSGVFERGASRLTVQGHLEDCN
jgi:hypothetical protein